MCSFCTQVISRRHDNSGSIFKVTLCYACLKGVCVSERGFSSVQTSVLLFLQDTRIAPTKTIEEQNKQLL